MFVNFVNIYDYSENTNSMELISFVQYLGISYWKCYWEFCGGTHSGTGPGTTIWSEIHKNI